MLEVARGIGLGVGFVIGAVLVLLVVVLLVVLVWKLYKLTMRRQFSPELFKQYGGELLRQERFEELNRVQEIIKMLENEQEPKEMLKSYEVNIDTDLEWVPTSDGGERLVFRRDRRIVRKKE